MVMVSGWKFEGPGLKPWRLMATLDWSRFAKKTTKKFLAKWSVHLMKKENLQETWPYILKMGLKHSRYVK